MPQPSETAAPSRKSIWLGGLGMTAASLAGTWLKGNPFDARNVISSALMGAMIWLLNWKRGHRYRYLWRGAAMLVLTTAFFAYFNHLEGWYEVLKTSLIISSGALVIMYILEN